MTAEHTLASAILSDCGRYRYRLFRGALPRMGIVMLNPSTADAREDDPTIRRVVDFAKRYGYAGIDVANIYALRSTDPRALPDCPDPFGANEQHLKMFALSHPGEIICAWGAGPSGFEKALTAHARRTVEILRDGHGGVLKCFGYTAKGHPKHPLYLSKETLLQNFHMPDGTK